jgi:excisionase family DNA binding protein
MIAQLNNRLESIEKLLSDSHTDHIVYMNIDEAATFLRMQKSTLYQYVFYRRIPYYKKGKKLTFSKSELVEWMNKNRFPSLEELKEKTKLGVKLKER